MSNTQHTPGPWSHATPGNIDGPKGQMIARVHRPSLDDYAGQEANAQLIAAAPEMLETLEVVAERCAALIMCAADDEPGVYDGVMGSIAIAIAKAKGEL